MGALSFCDEKYNNNTDDAGVSTWGVILSQVRQYPIVGDIAGITWSKCNYIFGTIPLSIEYALQYGSSITLRKLKCSLQLPSQMSNVISQGIIL